MNKRVFRIIAGSLGIFRVFVVMNGCLLVPSRSFPDISGTKSIEGISGPVEIIRDGYGVPHIYARSAPDLFFAQGYVHAQDRFWQMEFSRRLGAGRISEIFGDRVLDTDIFLRTMGFREVAETEYSEMREPYKSWLEAYCEGVNSYVDQRKPNRLGYEFALLELQGVDVEVDEWTPADTLTWGKLMAYDLGSNMTMERLAIELVRSAGLRQTYDYFSEYREDMPYIVPDEELEEGQKIAVESNHPILRVAGGPGMGSNAWVISGKLTSSGKPIVANDTHLAIQMPSTFYEIGLHMVDSDGKPDTSSPDALHVRRFSFPGAPGSIRGERRMGRYGNTNRKNRSPGGR